MSTIPPVPSNRLATLFSRLPGCFRALPVPHCPAYSIPLPTRGSSGGDRRARRPPPPPRHPPPPAVINRETDPTESAGVEALRELQGVCKDDF